MKYQPPFVFGATPAVPGIYNADADAAYVNGNPSTGQEGSYFPGEAIEHGQREIVAAVVAAGLTPDHTVLTQLRQAIARSASGATWFGCTGASNAYTLAATGAFDVPTSPFAGQLVRFKPNHTNTGAATATFAGGTKAIRTFGDAALAGGELASGRQTEAVYDPTANSGAGALLILPWANALTVTEAHKQPIVGYVATWAQTLSASVSTKITGYTQVQSNLLDATFSSGSLTIGPNTEGQWLLLFSSISPNAGVDVFASIIKGGTSVGYNTSDTASSAAGVSATSIPRLVNGDTVEFQTRQISGASKAMTGRLHMVKIGG